MKDLTPVRLVYSASFRTMLERLAYDMQDNIARALIFRRSYLGDGPKYATHEGYGNYLSMNAEGQISFLPASRMETAVNSGAEWQKKYRQAGRPAKVVRSMLTPEALSHLTDSDFEKFSNNIAALIEQDRNTIRVVSGEDLRTWYHEDNYLMRGTGTLRTSCMRYDHCQPYMDFYVNNEDVIQMVIVTDSDNLLIGRALVWNTNEYGWVLDRAYGNDRIVALIREWGREQGYPVRCYNSYEQETLWNVPGEEGKQLFFSVNLLTGSSQGYPYCDTFKYLFENKNAGTIRVKNHQRGAAATYVLDSTEGHPHISMCDACGDEFSSRDLYHGYCQACRLARECVACHQPYRGHGPDGILCERCAETCRCSSCGQYETSTDYDGRLRVSDMYSTVPNQGRVCTACFDQWVTQQECNVCHASLTRENYMIETEQDENGGEQSVRMYCVLCHEHARCENCLRVPSAGETLQDIRRNVNHPYRYPYTQRLCSGCTLRYCSFCGDHSWSYDVPFVQEGDMVRCRFCLNTPDGVETDNNVQQPEPEGPDPFISFTPATPTVTWPTVQMDERTIERINTNLARTTLRLDWDSVPWVDGLGDDPYEQ
jgi:hypothetical protein